MRCAFLLAAAVVPVCLARAEAADGGLSAEIELTAIGQRITSAPDAAAPPGGEDTASTASGRVSLSLDLGGGVSGVVTAATWDGEGFDPANDLTALVPVNGDIAEETDEALTEAYVTVKPEGSSFGLSLGLADVSSLFARSRLAGNPRTQFLNYSFRSPTTVEYPGGADAPYAEAAWLTLQGSGDSLSLSGGAARMDEATPDDEYYYFGELRFRPGPSLSLGLFAWHAEGPHARWDAAPDEDAAAGYGACLDYVPRGDFACFFRGALADPAVSVFEQSWTAGVQMHGTPWGRPADVVGLAFARNLLSDDYALSAGKDADEDVFEIYYRIILRTPDPVTTTPGIEITPDVQWITNAGGVQTEDTTVLGLRVRLALLF